MAVNLFAVREVLKILGAEDYGIFNVIAGIVTLLNFMMTTMASATQRFFSFALGKKDEKMLFSIVDINITIYALIALICVIAFETVGVWFIGHRLNIDPEKVSIAGILFQFMILRFVLTLISSPCISIIIAHEDMGIYAGICILEALAKLVAVFLLAVIPFTKLPLYGGLMAGVAFLVASMYSGYCIRKYKECSFHRFRIEKDLLKEIFGYTGWSLFGCLSTMFRTQAITILVNQFFSPIIISSRTIALQLSGTVHAFATNFNTGLYPPIIKAWASGDKEKAFQLVFTGCKIAFFLIWVFTLPCLLEMDFILDLWLPELPPHVVLFSRLALVETVITSVCFPIMTLVRANGRVGVYESVLGSIQIAIFPVSWLILYLGGEAYMTFVVAIVANVLMLFLRLVIARAYTGLQINHFLVKILVPLSCVTLLSLLLSFGLKKLLPQSFITSVICGFFSAICVVLSFYYIGLNSYEQDSMKQMILKKWKEHFA